MPLAERTSDAAARRRASGEALVSDHASAAERGTRERNARFAAWRTHSTRSHASGGSRASEGQRRDQRAVTSSITTFAAWGFASAGARASALHTRTAPRTSSSSVAACSGCSSARRAKVAAAGVDAHRSRNRARTAAWARWREKVEEGRAVKMAMRKFVYGAQAHAFARWREFYSDMLTLRRIASAMAHAERQSLRRCVDKWVAFVDGELDLKEKYKTAALKFFGNVKQKCFAEWVKYTVTMLRVKQLMGNGLRRQAKRALRAWSEEATVAKVLRTKSAFLQQNSAAGVGRRAFRIWIATMRGERHWRRATRRCPRRRTQLSPPPRRSCSYFPPPSAPRSGSSR